MTTTPEADEVPEYADPDVYFEEHPEFMLCRMDVHHWTHWEPAVGSGSYIIINAGTDGERWSRERMCPQCGTVQARSWNRFGMPLGLSTQYPADYVLKGQRMPNKRDMLDAELAAAQTKARKPKRRKRAA